MPTAYQIGTPFQALKNCGVIRVLFETIQREVNHLAKFLKGWIIERPRRRHILTKLKKKARCAKTKKTIFDLFNEQNPPKESSTDTKTVARVEDETKTVKKEETKTEEVKTEETKTEETKTEETKTEETKTEETKGGEENVV